MKGNRWRFLVSVVMVCASCAWGCDSDGRSDDEYVPEVDPDEEQAGCDAIPGGTTGGFVSASESMDGAMALAAGGKRIELTDFEGAKGGYVRIQTMSETGTTPLLLLVAENVPAEILDAQGDPVDTEAEGDSSSYCDVNARIFWIQEGENYLKLGPAQPADANISITVIK